MVVLNNVYPINMTRIPNRIIMTALTTGKLPMNLLITLIISLKNALRKSHILCIFKSILSLSFSLWIKGKLIKIMRPVKSETIPIK